MLSFFGDRKSLPIAKNHLKPSQEFREQIGPFLHKTKGFSKIAHQKVHPKFAKSLGRQILGNTFSGPNFCRFCTRDFQAPLIRLGDGSLLPIVDTRREKELNIYILAGLSRDWVGVKKLLVL